MTFARLYDEVQQREPPISTRWLKTRAIHFSPIHRIKEQWSGLLDPNDLRGFYIEGPLGPPITLAASESLIVLSREMCRGHQGAYWRRFVYTKELMHVFDADEEKADDAAKFDLQIEKFKDPSKDLSPQYRAEAKALWRALALLCPERRRLLFQGQLQQGVISPDVVAATLRIPARYVRELMRPDFAAMISRIKN
jgi:hypothetical protein